MRKPHLQLKEIIWEITGRCENGCDYCGSKECWGDDLPTDGDVIAIAAKICEFPPEAIDISGGDPLLFGKPLHKVLVERFKEANVKVKIIVNPKSVVRDRKPFYYDQIKKLEHYDWIGMSVNTADELELVKKMPYDGTAATDAREVLQKTTIITNFNLQNIFLFDDIFDFVEQYGFTWQVQYTMYDEPKNPLALYNNEAALKQFFEKLTETMQSDTRVVLADNLNQAPCGAGMCSIGILSNGDVVPCLSMRSWCKIEDVIEGNVLKTPLEDIWRDGFKKYRFGVFECCKDYCGNKLFELIKKEKPDRVKKTEELLKNLTDLEKNYPRLIPKPEVMLYGVTPDTGPRMYGTADPNTFVYGTVDSGWITTCESDNMFKEDPEDGQGQQTKTNRPKEV